VRRHRRLDGLDLGREANVRPVRMRRGRLGLSCARPDGQRQQTP